MTASSTIAQVKLLRPQPGDMIVVKVDPDLNGPLFREFVEGCRSFLEDAFPEHKIMFLGGEVDIEVQPK